MHSILKKAPKDIEKHLIKEKYKKNDSVLIQGDVNEYLYFILSGTLEVLTVSKQGKPITLSTFEAGESIGVLEIFNSELRTQTVIAMSDSTIIKLNKTYVTQWMKLDFDFTMYIVSLLQDLFYESSVFARNLISLTLEERVIISIYNHWSNNSINTLTKAKLIQETGTQKRSLNRTLEGLYKTGMIEYKDKEFKVLKQELLLNKAQTII